MRVRICRVMSYTFSWFIDILFSIFAGWSISYNIFFLFVHSNARTHSHQVHNICMTHILLQTFHKKTALRLVAEKIGNACDIARLLECEAAQGEPNYLGNVSPWIFFLIFSFCTSHSIIEWKWWKKWKFTRDHYD